MDGVRVKGWIVSLVFAALALTLPLPALASTGDEQRFVDLINQERRAVGAGPLVVVPELVEGARAQAQAIADEGRLFHNRRLGDLIDGWYRLGENVGSGSSVASVHAAFMNSPPHRENLLLATYDGVGTGVVWDSGKLYVAVVFIDSIEPLVWSGEFYDDDDSVHEADIDELAAAGVTKGCATNRYCPDRAVTRAEMATMLVRAFGLTGRSDGAFADDNSSEHESAIETLAANGITTGCGPDTFCPDRAVTRAEMATFLTRVLDLPQASSAGFDDVAGNVHAGSIDALAAAGITKGCSAQSFCPHSPVTRAQMASFLVRAMG